MRPALVLLAALAAALTSAACLSYQSVPHGVTFGLVQPGVALSSRPSGARIYVNGEDSGFMTPAHIALPKGEWHRVDFALAGYRTSTRIISPDWRLFTVYWSDGNKGYRTWRFPLWMDGGDLFPPAQHRSVHTPARIHVQMRLDSDR
jgi:hypothetical protein